MEYRLATTHHPNLLCESVIQKIQGILARNLNFPHMTHVKKRGSRASLLVFLDGTTVCDWHLPTCERRHLSRFAKVILMQW